MKRIVHQILDSIRNEPDKWSPSTRFGTNWDAITKDGVTIDGVGNTAILSMVNILIDKVDFATSYIERYRLEKAVLNWYQNCPMEKLNPEKS